VTDDNAFKELVRARMAETGEKYTVARRTVIARLQAAEDTAIRDAVRRSLEEAIGLSSVEVDRGADRVHVTIRAARPGVVWGLRSASEFNGTAPEGVWRETPAERLRGELEELTGKRLRLEIRETRAPT
jgi:hypothetical protein